VGRTVYFRATSTGELICFANDAHTEYWNNKGDLQVTATRVSWPPSNESYYYALYKPSCDAAVAVYANYGDATNSKLPCNSQGGGSGWTAAEVTNTNTKYESGAPSYLLT
jgi:hypothetical protein